MAEHQPRPPMTDREFNEAEMRIAEAADGWRFIPAAVLRKSGTFAQRLGTWVRTCSACGEERDQAQFTDDSRSREPWCRTCVKKAKTLSDLARSFRRDYPAVSYEVSIGVAALLLGDTQTPRFQRRKDHAVVLAALLETLNYGQNQDKSECPCQSSKHDDTYYSGSACGQHSSTPEPERRHVMVVRPVEPIGDGPVSYRSNCLSCDSYSSKYWDPADCPTSHIEGNCLL